MSIITIIYLAIALLVFVSTLYNMIFKEERLVDQINAAMIPQLQAHLRTLSVRKHLTDVSHHPAPMGGFPVHQTHSLC